VGIPWSGSGAARKVAFMLVREVSDSVDMVIPGRVVCVCVSASG
jgi:hypothetical protein